MSIYTYIYIYIYIYIVFTTEGLFEVAIESWPEWDLNPRLLDSVQTLYRLSYQAVSPTRTPLYRYATQCFLSLYSSGIKST